MPEPSPRSSSPWLAISGAIAVYFSFGLAIGLMPPMVDEISADLGLSRSVMGSILGAWALIYVFTAVPAGAVVDRLGIRRAMLLGGLSIAASMVLRSLATNGLTLFLAVAVFGIGGPLVSIATPKLVASLFDEKHRRLPTGLAVASPGLGSALGFSLPNPVLLPALDGSWRAVLAIGAIVAILACVYWLGATRSSLNAVPPAERTAKGTLGRLLRHRPMRWILWISLFLFAFSHGLNGWLPEILSDAGLSDDNAGYVAAASTVAGISGSMLIARLVPDRWRSVALSVVYLVLGAAVIGLGTLDGAAIVIVSVLIGFVRAGPIPLMFLEMMGDDEIDLSDMGTATGLFFAAGEIGGFGGPWGIGLIADRTEGFGAATVALSFVCIAALIGTIGLRHSTNRTLRPHDQI